MSCTMMYFLVMLDGIRDTAGALQGVFVFVAAMAGIATIVWLCATDGGNAEPGAPAIKRFARCLRFWALLGLVSTTLVLTFVPSTKQAAVILVVPAVVNSEFVTTTIPKEAKEIYALAKQWMRERVEEGCEKTK